MISKESVELIKKFRDDRDWAQFHNPKDLAISINLEASELLEIFQWSGEELECSDKLERIKEELADVLCYCVLMADRCGLDMNEIIQNKMKKNGEKYPVESAFGSKEKYAELKKERQNENKSLLFKSYHT